MIAAMTFYPTDLDVDDHVFGTDGRPPTMVLRIGGSDGTFLSLHLNAEEASRLAEKSAYIVAHLEASA